MFTIIHIIINFNTIKSIIYLFRLLILTFNVIKFAHYLSVDNFRHLNFISFFNSFIIQDLIMLIPILIKNFLILLNLDFNSISLLNFVKFSHRFST